MCCSPYRNGLDMLKVKVGFLCRFFSECEHYRATSYTCNKSMDKTYCGKYRELIDKIMDGGSNE